MKIKVDCSYLQDNYPDAVAAMMDKLEAGTSKEKGSSPEDLEWSFFWGERIEGSGSFADMIKKHQQGVSEPPNYDLDARVNKRLKNIVPVYLEGKIGRWRSTISLEDVGYDEIPVGVVSHLTSLEADKIEQEKEADSLTDEEREARVNDILGQLKGTPGFFGMQIPVPKQDGGEEN